MPSRTVTSFLPFPAVPPTATKEEIRVNALSGCYLISTELKGVILEWGDIRVNALSGCYLISTVKAAPPKAKPEKKGVNALSGCYLISTRDSINRGTSFKPCQCPLGLLPHFYSTPSKN